MLKARAGFARYHQNTASCLSRPWSCGIAKRQGPYLYPDFHTHRTTASKG